MSDNAQRWPHDVARRVAEELVATLEPAAEFLAIAGSLRRGRPVVGDIELVYVPLFVEPVQLQPGLFSDPPEPIDGVDAAIKAMTGNGILARRKNGNRFLGYGPFNKLLIHVPTGIAVDIYSSERRFLGMCMFVRTGPAEWNRRAAMEIKFRNKHLQVTGGIKLPDGTVKECPEEIDVFDEIPWPYLEPDRRDAFIKLITLGWKTDWAAKEAQGEPRDR